MFLNNSLFLIKLISFIRGGAGNDFIVDKLVTYIADNHKNIKYVLVLWSDFLRFSMYNLKIEHLCCTCKLDDLEEVLHNTNKKSIYLENRINFSKFYNKNLSTESFRKSIVNAIVRKTICHQFKLIELLCKSYNIEYYFMQGVEPVDLYCDNIKDKDCSLKLSLEKILEEIIFNQDYIDTDKFIGWPIYPHLGGFSFDSLTKNKLEYHVSESDRHPNENGMKLIADLFLQTIRKNND